jgi:hypothetical protein
MALSIGSFSATYLDAQPFGHDVSTVYKGYTARAWLISGLFTATEWNTLNSVYQAWRDLRIQDPDSVETQTVGTTVLFSGQGFGTSWSNIAVWFIEAPEAQQQVGDFVQGSVRVVDAAQKLQILLKEKEDAETEDLPNLGTITLGTTVITLTRPPETLENLPQLESMAAGGDYALGPLAPRSALNIEGHTTAAGWAALVPWAKAALSVSPVVGAYWPTSAPTAAAENKIVDGVKIVRYNVQISVAIVQ